MKLAENMKPLAVICVSDADFDNRSSQAFFAAKELRYYFNRMSCASFEIKRAGECENAVTLSLAEGDDALRLGVDGFHIVANNDSISIVGGNRGVIYGAYELLERMGCRFFTCDCEKIPTKPNLEIEPFETEQIPVLEYREHNYRDLVQNPKFAVKCRLNGAHHPIPDNMGGRISYVWYVHTFNRMVPTEKYGESHPEYFALVDGERKLDGRRTQLCLTNPDVYDICLKSVREALLANPTSKIISISQNDTKNHCQCENCRKADLEEGSPAGTLLNFVNRIAKELEPEFPDVIFDTLAYEYSRPAPNTVRNRHNVCVRLCSIECCFAHPFETCDDEKRGILHPDGSRSSFINDLRDWGKICDRMYIWDYTTCFAHYPSPHPNWRVLQPNIKAMIKNNVKGIFEQANGASRGGVDFNELRLYLISKLLWNPDCDVLAHRKEFMEYYYGDAAEPLMEYLDLICDTVERENIHVGFNDNPTHKYLSEDMLEKYNALFDKAAAAVAGDALRLFRVEKNRLSIRWVALKRKTMLRGEFDPEEINRFFADWRAFGLSRIEEWFNIENTHRALLDKNWRATAYFDHWSGEEPEYL